MSVGNVEGSSELDIATRYAEVGDDTRGVCLNVGYAHIRFALADKALVASALASGGNSRGGIGGVGHHMDIRASANWACVLYRHSGEEHENERGKSG